MPKSIHTKQYQIFLQLLKKLRIEASVTQEELARRLGITQPMLSKMENGERRIDVVEILEICLVLELSPKDFFAKLVDVTQKV